MRPPKERTGKSPLAEEEDITHTRRKGDTRTRVVRQKRLRVRARWQIQRGAMRNSMQGNVHRHESGLNARRWTLPRPLCSRVCEAAASGYLRAISRISQYITGLRAREVAARTST